MFNPDYGLRPRIEDCFKPDEIILSKLNPFQLRAFLSIHRYVDNYLIKASKLPSPEQTQERIFGLLLLNEENPDIADDLSKQTAALMVRGQGNMDRLEELTVRGIMDIDEPTYRTINEYFQIYVRDISSSSRFLRLKTVKSRQEDYEYLENILIGVNRFHRQNPDLSEYSEAAYDRFQRDAQMRVLRNVAEEVIL